MNVIFDGNTAIGGGGLSHIPFSSIASTLTNVTFRNNSASEGGGGMVVGAEGPSLTVLTNVTFSNNSSAQYGGGAANIGDGNLILTNATFKDNTADTYGGGIANGGMPNITTTGTVSLTNTTFNANSAGTNGGAIYNESGTINLHNSILYGDLGGEIFGTANVNYSIVQGGYAGTGNLDADPLLGPLADNGGFTQTMALLPGSPAIDAGDDTNCPATDQRGVTRPQGSHCDMGAYEALQTFTDVAVSHWAWQYIERLYASGITGGCATNPLRYCPSNTVTRAQMAIFLLRGIHGASYTPPSASGAIFNDVTASTPGADWIEQLYAEGITSGCGGGNYCPNSSVTRAQMAIFLLRAKYGASYTPPSATGMVFSDVTVSTPGAAWIEQLHAEGITSGCGGGRYCPSAAVTRAEMAVFLVRTFNLP
ncbi:MAG TPA: choice-of-anchor Q domain-containing protein [Anaerolineales bacterium]|nr:choice-of-anchor Q domain-containing protein [Anaerolineales bacterium]